MTHENDAAVTSIIKPKVQASEDVAPSSDDSAADTDENKTDSKDSGNEDSQS